jgi:hypothetical protein
MTAHPPDPRRRPTRLSLDGLAAAALLSGNACVEKHGLTLAKYRLS